MSNVNIDVALAGLNPDSIARDVEAVLAEPLYWFPVRHHSPSTARHVAAMLQARKPKIVFIEGPFEANHLIPLITDPKTVPPIAIYSSYRDDDNVLGLNGLQSPAVDIPSRFAVWYPITPYAPEYVAMQTAAKLKAEVVFIDLPHHAQLSPKQPDAEHQPVDDTPSNDDRLITSSGFYQHLAAAAGYKTWNEAWDTLFEDPHTDDFERFRKELATFCAAARATADPEAEKAEGTVERERHFLKVIRNRLKTNKLKPEDAVVICGGFHLFMDRTDTASPPEPPAGTVYTTLIPYSFFRIAELTGYGAGNRAPQFYQTFHDLTTKNRAKDIPLEHAIAILRLMRKQDEPLSTADAIAITHHAELLARLRNRNHPTLDDIVDAVVTCCCKGNPNVEGEKLLAAIDNANIGNTLGKVTSKLGRLPIVNDFHNQLSDLDLGEPLQQEKKLRLKIDKRDPLDARRSAFLHRLSYLKVPFAVMQTQGGDFSGTIFRETFDLKWDPKTEPTLVEQNLYGDTVEAAALSRLQERIAGAGRSAGESCKALLDAVDMDLPALVRIAEEACGPAIDNDASFVSLAQALRHLTLLDQYVAFRGLRRETLNTLQIRCFDRACFALPDAATAPESEQNDVVGGIVAIAELVQRDDRYDRNLFAEGARMGTNQSNVPFLRGAFLGLLCEIRELPATALAVEVAGLAQAAPERMVTAGDLLDGMLAVSRTSVMLGADDLIAAVDELLKAAEWDPFLMMLPRLRGAFERLANAQRDSLAHTVAQRYGLADADEVQALPSGLAATALVTRLDAAVARTLANWTL